MRSAVFAGEISVLVASAEPAPRTPGFNARDGRNWVPHEPVFADNPKVDRSAKLAALPAVREAPGATIERPG